MLELILQKFKFQRHHAYMKLFLCWHAVVCVSIFLLLQLTIGDKVKMLKDFLSASFFYFSLLTIVLFCFLYALKNQAQGQYKLILLKPIALKNIVLSECLACIAACFILFCFYLIVNVCLANFLFTDYDILNQIQNYYLMLLELICFSTICVLLMHAVSSLHFALIMSVLILILLHATDNLGHILMTMVLGDNKMTESNILTAVLNVLKSISFDIFSMSQFLNHGIKLPLSYFFKTSFFALLVSCLCIICALQSFKNKVRHLKG